MFGIPMVLGFGFGNPVEVALIVGAAVLLFGGGKIRDVARSLGAAQREFKVGQTEADLEADRLRQQAASQTTSSTAAPAPPKTSDPS